MEILAILDTTTHHSPYLIVWKEDVFGIERSVAWNKQGQEQFKRPLKQGSNKIPPGLKDGKCYELRLNTVLIPIAIKSDGIWWDI